MRSREPPAAPGLMRNIMSRQEATPSKQVCQENRLKVGLGVGREGRALRACRSTASPNSVPWTESFPLLPLCFRGHRHLLLSPEVGGRGPLQAQAGQVHRSIGHQVEDSDHSSQCIQLPSQEHQLDEDQEAGVHASHPVFLVHSPSPSPSPSWQQNQEGLRGRGRTA